uniref:Uncharacterized protein n=1 Tax=uncultured marine virus TaxID=186617 RepID=A0A0F7L572_9VIRU|nr:hypothetical protein [uncultured marine virus]
MRSPAGIGTRVLRPSHRPLALLCVLASLFCLLLGLIQSAPCSRSHRRNLSISKGFKSVHPSGHPMSHATHIGFNAPPRARRGV